jgi:RNA polymerase sigma factor (sigma-70 family)
MSPLARICDPGWLKAAATTYGRSVPDMQDIAQIAGIKYWLQRRQGTIRHESAYLTQVIRRTIIDEARSAARQPMSREIMDYDRPLTRGTPADRIDMCELLAERLDLDGSIERLPRAQRDVVRQLLDGKSVRDIAQQRGVREQAVRALKSRAVRALRQEFSDCDTFVTR